MGLIDTSYDVEARIAGLVDGLTIVAARRLGNEDDARDAVQETVARLIARIREGAVPPESELAPVAYGIARHVITDTLRKRARLQAVPVDLASGAPSPLDVLVTKDAMRALRIALARLSPDDRELLRRCFVYGERVVDIAGQLGEPAERVRKRKSRALQRLGELLRGAGRAESHETRPPTMEGA